MPQSESEADYDGEVEEIPYEEAREDLEVEGARLRRQAMAQLREDYERKGDGWQFEEPRYHMWKACDEFFSATHAVHEEKDLEAFNEYLARGYNHLLMARYLAIHYVWE